GRGLIDGSGRASLDLVEEAAANEDSEDRGRRPTLILLRRLLEAVWLSIDDPVDDLGVDADLAVRVAAEEFCEAADLGCGAERLVLEHARLFREAVAEHAFGDHRGVHRPHRSVVIGAGPKSRRGRR